MKINYIYISGYRNLNSMEISLAEGSTVNAMIGNNGSGKSNVLEALTLIFSKISLGEDVEFLYKILYTIDEDKCEISNISGKKLVQYNGKALSKANIKKAMPKALFLYYCGETARLKEMCLEYVDKAFESAMKEDSGSVLKYITYLTVEDFGAALLANVAFENETSKKIFDIVGIECIHQPIIVKLKKPRWASNNGNADNLWNARGTVASVIRTLLSVSKYDTAQASKDQKSADIIINDISLFKTNWNSASDLFVDFKLLMQADILQSIEFDVSKRNSSAIHSYMNLSEGEKQLSQLLSMLDIMKEYKALFLLDEFDSYLHPGWQRIFVDIINDIDMRGQVMLTTHSMLTIGKMKKENIILLKDGNSYTPTADTYNRDVSEILEELMDVSKRPMEASRAIKAFKSALSNENIEETRRRMEELEGVLSDDDPFWITARISLSRLERIHK